MGDSILLADLGDRAPADVAKELTVAKAHPPIPVQFTLKEPGFVTLVIEDAQGNRVRNLISETYCPAGPNTIWWNGLDDHRAKNVGTTGLGGFAGAAYLAYDAGPRRNPADDAYAVAIFWGDTLYVRALRGQSPQPVLRPDYTFPKIEGSSGVVRVDLKAVSRVGDIAGLAACNGMLVVSAPRISGPNITRDLSFVSALTGVISPVRFTDAGVPVYDVAQMKTRLPDAQTCKTSGGDQVTLGRNGDIALTMPLKRDPCHYGISGVTAAGAHWFYPNKWHGLHASQTARPGRIPDPGELIVTTRVLGPTVTPGGGSDAGEIWDMNANSGVLYLFTTDGLFASSLFKNGWIAAHQGARAVRGMLLNEASTEGESFYPSITQTSDGKVYIVGVEHTSSIVCVDGLDSIRRLPPWAIVVAPEQLEACRRFTIAAEAERVAAQGRGSMTVGMPRASPVVDDELTEVLDGKAAATPNASPTVDGELRDWTNADWVVIAPGTRAAAAVVGDQLVVAYHTTHADLLKNSGAAPWQAIFKTGGGLDIMLGTRRPGIKSPAAADGDLRLIVALVEGKPRAVLYRPVAPGTPEAERVPFGSPARTIYLDRVTDISTEVSLALGKPGGTRPPWAAPDARNVANGTAIELSVPLKTLGLTPQPGLEIAGDLGILKGDGAPDLMKWRKLNARVFQRVGAVSSRAIATGVGRSGNVRLVMSERSARKFRISARVAGGSSA